MSVVTNHIQGLSSITFINDFEDTKTSTEKKLELSEVFKAVLSQSKLEVKATDLEQIICMDLSIDIKNYDRKLMEVLIDALRYYVVIWPGWRRRSQYNIGDLPYLDWFEKFKQYLIFKCNVIIKNTSRACITEDKEVQAGFLKDNRGCKLNTPYTLCVGAPPTILNNIVFVESKGNIVIKQYSPKPWNALKLKEFLNWPNVSVEIKLPDISFSRANIHNIQRHISFCGDITIFPDVNYIGYIKKAAPNIVDSDMKPYSYDFMAYYFKQLLQVFKAIGIYPDRLEELESIIAEFLSDIKETKIYDTTICSYTSVAFHIGGGKYIRNKKMVSRTTKKITTNVINYYEHVVPEMEYTLLDFKAEQDSQDINNITFKSLNDVLIAFRSNSACEEIQKFKFLINNTCVIYNCTLCKKSFSGPHSFYNLTQHFQVNHMAEQSVLCFSCRREIDCKELASKRWVHNCS